MKEYIERDEAIKELCQVSAPTPSESYIVEKCIEKLDNMLAVDVVEVVRCKDCEYYRQNEYSPDEDMMCMCWCDWLPTDPDDFCSSGKRKID